MTTTPPVTARRAQTRDRLIEAAVQVFAERGVLGSSVEEICERAGFTRGAFYSNFDSKDELCLALARQHCDEQMERVRQILETTAAEVRSGDIHDLLGRAVSYYVDLQGTDRVAAVALAELQLYAVRNPDFAPTYRRVDVLISQMFAEIIDDAVTSRGYRFVLPAQDIITMVKGVFAQYTLDELSGVADASQLTDQLVRLLQALIVEGTPSAR